jgi:hypothetical protein
VSQPAVKVVRMHDLGYSTPSGDAGPCWHCAGFVRLLYGGSAALCARSGVVVRALPAQGCAFYVREPGSDDEPDRVPATCAPSTARAGVRPSA